MKLLKTLKNKNCSTREAEVYEHKDGSFEVFNMVADQLSRAFPCKPYKTLSGAERYANKFLNA